MDDQLINDLRTAQTFIAVEREGFIRGHTIGSADDPLDLSTLDADACQMLADDYDPALKGVEAAIAALTLLQDEVSYWRQDAACRLQTAVHLAKAAERKGEADRVAEITVSIILPTRAALAGALAGDIYYPLCEGCSKLLQEGDAVFQYEDVGEVHVNCEDPQMAAMPADAHRYIEDLAFSPAGIAKILESATAYLDGRA